MNYIVTVRLPKNPEHDPRNKKIDLCPLKTNRICTDVTGEHHSYLVDATNLDDAGHQASDRLTPGSHITRIEAV